MEANDLQEPLLSAYHPNRSTKTTLIKICDDIFLSMNNKRAVLLALLDLSVAFDTVDHKIMMNRLEHVFGITGTTLKWFKSYLSGRSQRVSIAGAVSHSCPLDCCVPQGSVLGPTMYSQYTRPIRDIIRSDADDSQVYLITNLNNPKQQVECFKKIESCISDLSNWMFNNKLKLNDDKTEFLLLGSKVQTSKLIKSDISVGDHIISSASVAKNLGVWIDRSLTLEH